MGIPPIYAAPLYRGRGDLKSAILDYNRQLRANSVSFQAAFPDAVVLFFDAYTAFGEVSGRSTNGTCQ